MEGNESYDPLLGCVTKRLDDRARSGSSRTAPGSAADAQPQSKPLAEAIRDASHALNLHDVAAAGWLHWVVSSTLSDQISPEAFKQYRDILLEDAGRPSDPIERMLVEQLALAHFSIGRLQIKACAIDNAKLSVAYSDAATRLLGEFRRCSLALEEYRARQSARKDQHGSTDTVAEKERSESHGTPRPPTNGKKPPLTTKQGSNRQNTEMPEWLRKRMAPPIPNESPLAAATGSNGKP